MELQVGKGGAKGQVNGRHKRIKYAVNCVIHKNGSQATTTYVPDNKEPNCADFFPRKPGRRAPDPSEKKIRGDIQVTLNGVTKILDVVISHPRAYANPLAAVTGGITAHNAALEKEDLYYKNFVIPAGHMVPLIITLSYCDWPISGARDPVTALTLAARLLSDAAGTDWC